MPYASAKQANMMRAVAHSPSFAKKVGIPQSVGQKFEAHKAKGGALKESEMAESKKMVGKELAFMKKKGAPKSMIKHEMAEAKGKGYASGGGIRGAKTVTKTGTPQEEFAPNYRTPVRSPGLAFAKGGGIESKGKTKGKMVKMAMGGKAC